MGIIGFVDFTTNTQNVRGINAFVLDIIRAWNTTKGFDAVIWSDFAPNFSNISQQRFLVENLISFLDALPENEKIGAIEYIQMAPKQVKTGYRAARDDHFSQEMEQL